MAAGNVVAKPTATSVLPMLRRRESVRRREIKSPAPSASAARVPTTKPNFGVLRESVFDILFLLP
jgi:hypothetical protein